MIPINAEIPEGLFHQMKKLVESNPSMSADVFVASAIAAALRQNGVSSAAIASAFVEAIANE